MRNTLRCNGRAWVSGSIAAALVCAVCLTPRDSDAGSGIYVGAEFGFFDFLNTPLENGLSEGGYTFGPKAGLYFIESWFSAMLDVTFEVGLVGSDHNKWFLELPTIGFGVGTGVDAFMAYFGGGFSLVGVDRLDDTVRISVLNPYASAGLQAGYEGFIVRGEFQIGYNLRFADYNYAWTNIMITMGYGWYIPYL